ncbi:MAG: 30S ribosomal protein S5 [Candidatus Kerfeldbacteria bacterium]|nr:30S ribosomal protein S5 [Candidatus Kerfeldbacteria bacterium]
MARGRQGGGERGRGRDRRRRRSDSREQSEYDQKIIDIARVTRVMAGGKRMRFRACVVIGNRKGRVGVGLAKGADVSMAIQKAVAKAEKALITVQTVNETIPHTVEVKYGAAQILLKPASKGTGVISGGPSRAVLELAGVKNVVTKMKGSKNKVNNVLATLEALSSMRTNQHYANLK